MSIQTESRSRNQVLVTGLSGFVGTTLKHMMVSSDDFSDWQISQETPRLDLLSPQSLDEHLSSRLPSAVIHLAGQTFVPEAFRDPENTLRVNLLGTLNLLQALKRAGFNGTFLYVSSGDIYGKVAEADLPVTETHIPHPGNPYAVSKLAAEHLCYQWSCVEPWRIIIARPFNHIGPGQSPNFVVASVARQIARIKTGLQAPTIDIGDVDVTRDFLDVRDVIRAYFALLDLGRSSETYNVCSGTEVCVRDMIDKMVALAGVDVELVQDPARLRPSDQKRMRGSNEKLKREIGWKPILTLENTLTDILADWTSREADG